MSVSRQQETTDPNSKYRIHSISRQGVYQSHFRWVRIKTVIFRFFSLNLVIFEKKINGK